ncbi:MAG: NAD(P)-dependent oxidoreductase [Chloroflexota bacterium]
MAGEQAMKQTVGFVGLGNMGKGMAGNLLKAGFPLIAYDIRTEVLAEMAARGARAAKSLAEVGAEAETTVVMVLNYPQLQEVILDITGLASAMKPGSTIIVGSTISPFQAKALATALAEKGIDYVDAPVSGGKFRAADGTLTIMAGAEPQVFEAQKPILDAMSANLYNTGPIGTGQVAKMCNQLMCGTALVATAECMTLAAKLGMDRKLLYEIITQSSGDGWMFRNRADRMIAGDFETKGRLDIFTKDLGIVLDTADQIHLPLLLTAAARQWVQMGVAEGYAGEDDSAVVKVMEQFAGLRPREETK